MIKRYKYIIIAVSLLFFVVAVAMTIYKYMPKEEVIIKPSETYYITVQKDIKTNFKGSYRRTFNDKNDVHLNAAKSYGIVSQPVDIEKSVEEGALEEVITCDYYEVDKLTHSHPYLVPHAKARLDELGEAFNQALAERGGGSYRFIITSVLRKETDIKRLRRWNVNSTENSAHLFGTTVDITYRRFSKYTPQFIISDLDLKLLLAETLQKFREEGKCYVKYEVKQGCFHITFR